MNIAESYFLTTNDFSGCEDSVEYRTIELNFIYIMLNPNKQ